MTDIPKYSEEFIIEEIKKLQYLYGLKREIRYQFERITRDFTESVAEHVYGMHVCATYFLPLEDPDHTWDWQKVFEMITWHDIDEIETGDTIGYLKTDADRAQEAIAAQDVVKRMPEVFQQHVGAVLAEYDERQTPEARFVKAIDKFEPQVHLYHEEGKILVQKQGTTFEEHRRIKEPYIKPFPHINAYSKVIASRMKDEGFFLEDHNTLFTQS